MAAGATGLREIYTAQVAADLLESGNCFRTDLNTICQQKNVPVQVTGLGPVLGFHFHRQTVRSPEQAALSNPNALVLFHMAMLEREIYLFSRGGAMLSIVHTDEDFDAFKSAFGDVLEKYAGLFNEMAENN